MTSLLLCAIALIAGFIAGRRSWLAGLVVVLAVGYAYGIVRANVAESAAHFIFDAAVVGLYLAQWRRLFGGRQRPAFQKLQYWVFFLTVWPAILFLVPVQDTMVELAGLRGAVFLLPFVLFGAKMEAEETYNLAQWLSALNLGAFGFAVAEYFLGVDRFFPLRQGVTTIIYMSNDLVNYTAFRIPATFTNAHAYAGTMVMTIPLLLGAWVQPKRTMWGKGLITAALAASLMGVFMAATRTHAAILIILLIIATLLGQLGILARVGWVAIILLVGWVVSSEERLQRVTTLGDVDMVAERIYGSVNEGFFSAAIKYPMGNGLGGGGTSLPYFLQDRVRNPIAIENEYARIMLEQGTPGLCLWLAFIGWVVLSGIKLRASGWSLGRRLAWWMCICYFVSGLTGTGLLTSIPATCLLLLSAGWVAVPQPKEREREFAAQPRFHGGLALESH